MAEFHPLPSIEDRERVSQDFALKNDVAESRAKECEAAKVPDLSHLSLKDYDEVYEPSDDTFLLLDGLHLLFRQETSEGRAMEEKSYRTLEIGCGTGVPTVFLAMELKKAIPTFEHPHFVTDINPHALSVAKATAEKNCIGPLTTVQCDLASGLLDQLAGSVDLLLFNPPYVPTPDDEVGSLGIEASWAGGLNGRRVVDRAIHHIERLLRKPTGEAFLITVDDNLPEEIAQRFEDLGLRMQPWLRRRARNEYLTVQRISWKKNVHREGAQIQQFDK